MQRSLDLLRLGRPKKCTSGLRDWSVRARNSRTCSTHENLQLAAAKLENGKTFDAPPRASVSPTNCQVSVKNSADPDVEGGADRETQIEDNPLDDQDLETWLGGRDSNPDTVVQSHVSYRWTTSQCPSRLS